MPAPRHETLLARPRGSLLVRAACVETLRLARGRGSRVDTDAETAAVLRAATSPIDTDNAAELIADSSASFIAGLAPASAAAALFSRALRLDLGQVAIPALEGGSASWVEELDAIPVRAMTASAPALTPRKLAAIVVMSRQLLRGSGAERLVADALNRKAARALDATLFGTGAASAMQPAGLLAGLTPLAAGADGIVPGLVALADEVSEYGTATFIASPGMAIAIEAAVPGLPVLASSAIASDTIIAVAVEALAYATGGADINSSIEGVVHMDDDPEPISVPGDGDDPAIAAAPARSMFQTDCIATRLLVEFAWTLREPGAVAYTEIAE